MDANMALFCVAPELRATGVMASMAAFFLFLQDSDKNRKVDSLGIFVIAPAAGIKMAYSPAVVGGHEPERMPQERMPQLHTFISPAKGSGYDISSYMPKTANDLRAKCCLLYTSDAADE